MDESLTFLQNVGVKESFRIRGFLIVEEISINFQKESQIMEKLINIDGVKMDRVGVIEKWEGWNVTK